MPRTGKGGSTASPIQTRSAAELAVFPPQEPAARRCSQSQSPDRFRLQSLGEGSRREAKRVRGPFPFLSCPSASLTLENSHRSRVAKEVGRAYAVRRGFH